VLNPGTDNRRVPSPASPSTGGAYLWTGISALPVAPIKSGAYIIRVEAYRDAFPLHYAQHQYQIFINRP
jgi:hypothetical protein